MISTIKARQAVTLAQARQLQAPVNNTTALLEQDLDGQTIDTNNKGGQQVSSASASSGLAVACAVQAVWYNIRCALLHSS